MKKEIIQYDPMPDDLGKITEILLADFSEGKIWRDIQKPYAAVLLGLPQQADILFFIQNEDVNLNLIRSQVLRQPRIKIIGPKLRSLHKMIADKEHTNRAKYRRWIQDYLIINIEKKNWQNIQFVRSTSQDPNNTIDDYYHNRLLCYEIMANKYTNKKISANPKLLHRTPIFLEGGDLLSGLIPSNSMSFVLVAEDIIKGNTINLPCEIEETDEEAAKKWVEKELKIALRADKIIWVTRQIKDISMLHLDHSVCLAGWTKPNKEAQQRIIIPEFNPDFCCAAKEDDLQRLLKTYNSSLEKYQELWNQMVADIKTQVQDSIDFIRMPAIFFLREDGPCYLPHLNCLCEYEGSKTTLYMPSFVDNISLDDKSYRASIPDSGTVCIEQKENMLKAWFQTEKNISVKLLPKNFNATLGEGGSLRCICKVLKREKPSFLST